MPIPFIPENRIDERTRRSRIDIGFSGRDAWRTAPAIYTQHSLTIEGHPVMEDWEESYMLALAEIAAHQGGTVLEVGFGMGIAAQFIQEYPIDRHIIIEANAHVYSLLESFAATALRPVTAIQGFWEQAVKEIPDGSLMGILFDTYPLCEEELHRNHFFFFKEAYRLLAPGGICTYYSDESTEFSEPHRQALVDAGFTDIQKIICPVSPPPDCLYWKKNSLLAPIIRK
jgi:guanidinoacetate N-methyltransferase